MATYLKRARPRAAEDTTAVEQTVREIVQRIKREGESAVREYSRALDKWDPPSFRVTEAEIAAAEASLSPQVKADIQTAHERVKDFASRQRATLVDFEAETIPGVILGQKQIPVVSVGCYIPGGRYPLIASALMSVLTAKVAGVKRVVACSPPRGEKMWPGTLYATALAGADEIYCLGGVQALAAMAFGTLPGLDAVDMIVGPGNKYVVEAKRQLFGTVGIDLLPGPTEILIIADDTADPAMVAADLIGQAEHDPASRQCLVTTSEALGRAVLAEIEQQMPEVPTREVAAESWGNNGEVVVVDSHEEAAVEADRWAPEHLEVQTENPRWYLEQLRNYGSLFVGEPATVLYSDKALGTNHILPTLGSARYTGGLWVGKFIKTVTYQILTEAGSEAVAPAAMGVAEAEGMLAHVITGRLRLNKYGNR
ncbi:MAG: histidinol dehydrogenase [Ardenticatenaceae bacterium]|nr:histidinol dehydrogenase [Ardenticatenaceae bacterium]